MNNQMARVVNAADGGSGWAVRGGDGTQLAVHRKKTDAVDEAKIQLLSSPSGGELQVYTRAGRLEERRTMRPTGVPLAQLPVAATNGLAERIESEGENWDHVISILAFVLPLLGAGGSAFMSPEVAAADDWFGVFFATLAWSLGCAVAVYTIAAAKVSGWPAAGIVGLSFALSIFAAYMIGVGTLDINAVATSASEYNLPGGLSFVAGVAATAFATFGFVGALLGGSIGGWLGWRFATHDQPL